MGAVPLYCRWAEGVNPNGRKRGAPARKKVNLKVSWSWSRGQTVRHYCTTVHVNRYCPPLFLSSSRYTQYLSGHSLAFASLLRSLLRKETPFLSFLFWPKSRSGVASPPMQAKPNQACYLLLSPLCCLLSLSLSLSHCTGSASLSLLLSTVDGGSKRRLIPFYCHLGSAIAAIRSRIVVVAATILYEYYSSLPSSSLSRFIPLIKGVWGWSSCGYCRH